MNSHTWKVSQLLSASIAISALGSHHIANVTNENTRRRKPTNANNAEGGFTSLRTAGAMNKHILERSLMSAGIAGNALAS